MATPKPLFAVLIALLFVFSSCSSSKNAKQDIPEEEGISYTRTGFMKFLNAETLTPVLDMAAEEHKLVFLDIYTDWCLPCKLMDEYVYTDKAMVDFMDEYFISYKVNGEELNGPDLVFLYDVKAFPGLIFLDTRGNVLVKKEGTAYQVELREMAKEAISKGMVSSN